MRQTRQTLVAGAFYPGEQKSLDKQVSEFLSKVELEDKYKNILGIISPHAGYMYSGQCAAYGFKALQQRQFDRAVLIAPSHRVGGFRFSVGDYDEYETPLGNLEVDKQAVSKLLELSGFDFIPSAHSSEHSLEVQLPFLKKINPEAKIVPIVYGNQNPLNSKELAEILVEQFKDELDTTVFIISSDLSHYYDGFSAELMDKKLIESVEKADIDRLENALSTHQVEACGFGGILTILHLSKKLGYSQIDTLNYTHSGKITLDNSQVVGYMATAIYK
jgi:hypothetical protein